MISVGVGNGQCGACLLFRQQQQLHLTHTHTQVQDAAAAAVSFYR